MVHKMANTEHGKEKKYRERNPAITIKITNTLTL